MERILGGFLWWWLIYHSVHEPGLVFGHFPYHHPETEFTDEELGVPPDSEGLAPVIANVRSIEIPGVNKCHLFFPPSFLKYIHNDEGMYKF